MLRAQTRFGSALEWIVAAAFLIATLSVGSLVVQALRTLPTGASRPTAPTYQALPPSLPAGAVSVPVLSLVDGREVRVGDPVDRVAAVLGRAAESGRQEVDRGLLGERLTRFYEHDGTRFILVFEPFERNGRARVAAIYLP